MAAPRNKLDPTDPHDRKIVARLGGYARWAGTTPEERSLDAQKRGEATLEKHGKGQFVRMNLIKNGRLAQPRKAAR